MIRRFVFALSFGLLAAVGVLGSVSTAQAYAIPINIESTPAGATVYLDSATGTSLGVTPLHAVHVARGNHVLIFKLANYEDGHLSIYVRRRRETFRIVLSALSTIVVSAGNDGAQGAAVRIDGQPVGNIPYRMTVQPGRHLLQVGREGYETFTQWVELTGAQVLTMPVMLQQQAPQTGSLLVGGDVSGAPVFLDGDPHGVTPTVIDNIPAGDHAVEIRPQGMDVHHETVHIEAGQRAVLNPTLRPAPAQTGSLRVVANVPNATVSLDGAPIGPAPATKDGVTPGDHILEATAEGYQPVQQPVTIQSGQQQVVSLTLTRQQLAPGRIVVNASVDGATVLIDGDEKGAPPVVVENAPPGTHAIVVRARGYHEYRTTCDVGPGHNCEVTAQMDPVATSVRVETPGVQNAHFFVDGQEQGPVPWEGTIPVGEHRVEVRAQGFQPHVEQVNLQPSAATRTFDVALVHVGAMSDEARAHLAAVREREITGAVTHGAAPLPMNLATLDLSTGWPYIAELRLGVGILDNLDAGFAMRTFGRITEFEGRAKLGMRINPQFSVGAQARFGGGIGLSRDPTTTEIADAMNQAAAMGTPYVAPDAHPINSWYLDIEGLSTLNFSDRGAFTLWLALDMYTDRYDFGGKTDAGGTCNASGTGGPSSDCIASVKGDRQNQARLRLGGALELVIDRYWNAFGQLEGIILGPSTPRRLFSDIFGFGIEDTELYFRLGITHKF